MSEQGAAIAAERTARHLEREKEIRRVARAYQRAFAGEDGTTILNDLISAFGINHPTFLPVGTRAGTSIAYDTHYAAIRSGQRDVYLHIMAKLNAPALGDANIEAPAAVLTGLSE